MPLLRTSALHEERSLGRNAGIALRNWDLLRQGLAAAPQDPQPEAAGPGRLADVLTLWVQGQRDYFLRKAKREDAKRARCESAVGWFLRLGVALIVVSMFLLPYLGPWGQGLLLVAAALAPVTAGLIHTHAENQALAEHIKQYARMGAIFNTTQQQVERCLGADDAEGARERLRALGQEALNENADWVLLHRERMLEVPKV